MSRKASLIICAHKWFDSLSDMVNSVNLLCAASTHVHHQSSLRGIRPFHLIVSPILRATALRIGRTCPPTSRRKNIDSSLIEVQALFSSLKITRSNFRISNFLLCSSPVIWCTPMISWFGRMSNCPPPSWASSSPSWAPWATEPSSTSSYVDPSRPWRPPSSSSSF